MSTEDYHLFMHKRLIYSTFKKYIWSLKFRDLHYSIETGKKNIVSLKKMRKEKCDEMKYVDNIFETTSLSDENYNSRKKEISKCLYNLSQELKDTKHNLTINVKLEKKRQKWAHKNLRKYRTSYNKSNYKPIDYYIMFDCPRLNIRSDALIRCHQDIMIESLRKRYESSLS